MFIHISTFNDRLVSHTSEELKVALSQERPWSDEDVRGVLLSLAGSMPRGKIKTNADTTGLDPRRFRHLVNEHPERVVEAHRILRAEWWNVGPRVEVAADASGGGGLVSRAHVGEDGRCGYHVYRSKDVNLGELEAIVAASLSYECPIRVLTDSEWAMHQLKNDIDSTPMMSICHDLTREGWLDVVKVKGHSGHPLHDLADQLAVESRKARKEKREMSIGWLNDHFNGHYSVSTKADQFL